MKFKFSAPWQPFAPGWARLRDRLHHRVARGSAVAAPAPAPAPASAPVPALAPAPAPIGRPALGAVSAPAALPALPALRGLGQWAALIGLLASGGLVIWVAATAWDLVSASRGLVAHRFTAPTLANFPALARTALLPANRLNPDLQRALAPNEDRLLRAVQNVAMFENARAEPLLRAAPSAVQAVVEGSPAARAHVEAGDIVKQVNGKEAGFVWDVYQVVTERPVRLLELSLLRGTETVIASLGLKEGERFDMSNHGLLFAVPDSVRYIGKTDAVRIAEQLRAAYIEPLPAEWQGSYIEGMLGLSNALVSNLSTLQAATLGSSNYLLGEDLLGWYQRQFNDNLGVYRLGLERLRMRQTEALLQLGWGVLAMAAAALLALGWAIRAKWVLR